VPPVVVVPPVPPVPVPVPVTVPVPEEKNAKINISRLWKKSSHIVFI